ncbi:MAG: acetyl-CoA carboxylase biotin carboxylase subunit [Deltaproteobacteria bacterium RIFOXYA12_FULL_61_11]|nr:MAG: acetyl-CoA carboxylase biotin carboxylase subunit [Deltaproteobacteria bacterium RIFOXYA12_FULL_61_11]
MLEKVLIANRGEIALRVIRACKELGIATVAVHSEVDVDCLHVKFADESVCLGPADPRNSYLSIPAVMSAAEITGAGAIHPGYGFLAERHEFAEICQRCGLHFIGPTASTIKFLGDKVEARRRAAALGIPIILGSDAGVSSIDEALAIADELGYPVLLKAAKGGGGRGMRLVRHAEDLKAAFLITQREALAGFGDDAIYLERYLEQARHVEVQILGDEHGNLIQLGERDCSVQRRHQKLMEESPAPNLSAALRSRLWEAALTLARSVAYVSAGTAEFLVTPEEDFFFIEMNARLQVEHPVTEEITGLDVVKEQLRIAGGAVLSRTQDRVSGRGHALECRINAEDPLTFAPSPGTITAWHIPSGMGVRFDSAGYINYRVKSNYDALIGKLIVHAEDRLAAIRKMQVVLDEMVIEGIKTNIPLLRRILAAEDFLAGRISTRFLDGFRK